MVERAYGAIDHMNGQRRRQYVDLRALGITFLAAAACACAQHATADSLRVVVDRAISNHPDVQAMRANRMAIDEELVASQGLGRPKLDVRSATGHIDTNEKKGGIATTNFSESTRRVQGGVTASVPVFDGFKTRYEVEKSASRVDSARNRLADTANSIALQAAHAYLEVQRTQAVIAISERNVAAHRNMLGRVSARVSGGRSAEADATQARARLSSAQGAFVEARARHREAMAIYISVVGEQPQRLLPVSAPTRALPRTVDAAIAEAVRNAPSVIALMHDADAAMADIKSARSEFYPKVSLDFGAGRRHDMNEIYGKQIDLSALVVVRMNLYNGGIDAARIRESRWRADQARFALHGANRIIEKEIRLSWLAIQTATERRDVLGRQLEQGRKLVQAYTQQFDLGRRTLLDLLNVMNEAFVTESALMTERFTAVFNVFRVLGGMGAIVQALDLGLPAEATMAADRTRRHLPP